MRDLRMTPQEMREEMKNLEGNPQMIARRRQVQRQLAMHRLTDAVPKADVAITNPTELAIAVQYLPDSMACADRGGQGGGADRAADPSTGLGERHSHRGEEAAGPGPLPVRRNRSPDSARQVRRGGRGSGVRLPAQREEDSRGAAEWLIEATPESAGEADVMPMLLAVPAGVLRRAGAWAVATAAAAATAVAAAAVAEAAGRSA